MQNTKPLPPPTEAGAVYQIRIQPELKTEFMKNCHAMALNPSAVLRMLMTEWTQRQAHKKDKSLFSPPSHSEPLSRISSTGASHAQPQARL